MKSNLVIENLTKYYGSGSVVTKALDGVSFEVEQGSFTAIMGASGSGKSTLLNCISTIDRPSAGDIRIEGKSITQLSENELSVFRRDRLGFIFQEYNLLDTLTAGENIVLPLNLRKTDAAETRKSLENVAGLMGIADILDKFPREMSGGQRQRVACARALITQPAVVLADEPTGALDSANSRQLMKTMQRMNTELSSTILMVTHDAVVGSYADRVLFLKDGKLWNEILKGERTREEVYADILAVTASLGGESDVG
ncbi:MAG: ABC transporter ATP-binding protein [Clostridiales bacterium]|jgi:putative ABC transport system ATP-binding protein|nr:ABC transporter ATP-binding protein [Clostridiales bacterium]